ncbi:polysaccharide biosynthesis protein [Paenibacillus sp. UNC499MF]|uniref:polysaccharide biosynthesis protein n=1 Tax=Paenibacillus sp. UNC499MF TaxID=1502751 RepID=UPI00089FD321|nr:polysaccharide biosynthesis protein [Paenibacillus sp. UNC499MF]SEG76486.1 Membrane protein involved in the export of O-antigen and teichoic acid [Paenibacillus sp. UNC499MF]
MSMEKRMRKQPVTVKSSLFLKGAAVLAAAAVFSKLLGTLQKIPLQNIAGDGAFGIYNAVYPLYLLILFLATAGFPIAVAKFVGDRAAVGDHEGARRVAAAAALLLTGTGLICFLLLYFGADSLAGWIGTADAAAAIRSISYALLLVPVLSVLRGYFQGYQNMVPTAVSQVVEQTVRVLTMVLLLLYLTKQGAGDGDISAGATFGSVTGGAGAMLLLLFYWQRSKERRAGSRAASKAAEIPDRPDSGDAPHSAVNSLGRSTADKPAAPGEAVQAEAAVSAGAKEPFGRLMLSIGAYALPICLGSIMTPILNLIDAFTIPRLLLGGGADPAEAMRQFGLYNHGLPLVQAVTMVASSLTAVLVPAIAAAKAADPAQLQIRTERTVRMTGLLGLAAAAGLASLTVPVNVMLYQSEEASGTMALLALTALFGTLNIVLAGVLQGLGAVNAPALHLLAAAAVKIGGSLLLVPRWGIAGAAVSAVLAFAAASALGLAEVRRLTGAPERRRASALAPLAAAALMCAALGALQFAGGPLLGAATPGLGPRGQASVLALAGVALGAAVYALALLRLGAVNRAELEQLPAGGKLASALTKLRLLPQGERP